MSTHERFGIRSTAKIGGHPIHPMLIPIPIASLIGALLTDLAFWGSGGEFWATASAWLIGAGLVGGAAAAVAGLTDFLGNSRIRAIGHAWQHFLGNGLALMLAAVNLYLRVTQGAAEAVLPVGLVLSFVIVGILVYTGWLGGELVYHHRIGVMEPEASAAVPRERDSGRL